jgi:multidrug efflux pump subunit AcrB
MAAGRRSHAASQIRSEAAVHRRRDVDAHLPAQRRRGDADADRHLSRDQYSSGERRLDLRRHEPAGHSESHTQLHERQLASLVDDISRIEAISYEGVGVEKVYLHEGADVSRAVSQLASSALVVLKYMPPNITPPLVLRYGATDVPIIQLSLSSDSLTDTKLNDLGQNVIRPYLAVVHGAEVPYPYGGKPRVIMVDLDQQALQSRGLTPEDVSQALQRQNVILPAGDVKIGSKDYMLTMNNSPDVRSPWRPPC